MILLKQLTSLNTIKTQWGIVHSIRFLQFNPKISSSVSKTLRLKGEESFRRIDHVDKEYQLIYNSPLHYSLNMGKFIPAFTTVTYSMYLLYDKFFDFIPAPPMMAALTISSQKEFFWASVILLTWNVLVYFVANMVTLRIYQHGQNYVAIMPGMIPRVNNQVHFHRGDIQVHPFAPKYFEGIIYKVKRKSLLLIPPRFRKPSEFNEMLSKP